MVTMQVLGVGPFGPERDVALAAASPRDPRLVECRSTEERIGEDGVPRFVDRDGPPGDSVIDRLSSDKAAPFQGLIEVHLVEGFEPVGHGQPGRREARSRRCRAPVMPCDRSAASSRSSMPTLGMPLDVHPPQARRSGRVGSSKTILVVRRPLRTTDGSRAVDRFGGQADRHRATDRDDAVEARRTTRRRSGRPAPAVSSEARSSRSRRSRPRTGRRPARHRPANSGRRQLSRRRARRPARSTTPAKARASRSCPSRSGPVMRMPLTSGTPRRSARSRPSEAAAATTRSSRFAWSWPTTADQSVGRSVNRQRSRNAAIFRSSVVSGSATSPRRWHRLTRPA